MNLAELLEQPTLNLTALNRDELEPAHLERSLHDVRLLELPGEAARFRPNGLALTTGLWMGRRSERQLEFVEALAEHGVIALGLRVGVVVPRLPDALVQACTAHGILAVKVPPTVTLESVARTLTANQDLPLEVIQRELARMLEAGSEQGMLVRLEQLIRSPVALFAPWGHVMHQAGDMDAEALWRRIRHPNDADRITETPDGPLQSLPVRLEGRSRAVLIAPAPDLEHAARIRPALEFARLLLEAGSPGRREATDQERLVRGGLLRELLLEPWDATLSPARLEAFGFDATEPIALAIVEVRDTWAHTRSTRSSQLEFRRLLDDLRQAGETHFQVLGVPFLTGTLSAHALLAWQTRTPESHLTALHKAIIVAAPASDVRVGISRSHPAPNLPTAEREAHFAARAVREVRGARSFARLDALEWVAATAPQQDVQAIVDATLGAIRAHDQNGSLEQTLRVYLEHDRNQTKTAALLEVHLNTLRYRLKRIEEIIGASVDDTQTLTRLQFALLVSQRR